MIDEYWLFGEPGDGDAPIDADTALVTAYLARELTPVQVAAVERRRTGDPVFARAFASISDAWSTPLPRWEAGSPSSLIAVPPPSSAEIETGWHRFASEPFAGANRGPQLDSPGTRKDRWRETSWHRIAAAIALIVLPIGLTAQLAIYAANHPGTPGHELARSIVPRSLVQEADPQAVVTTLENETVWIGDGPVQISLAPARQQSQRTTPIVELSPPTAKSALTFGGVLGVNELSDGRLLVNDAARRRLFLLEPSLTASTTVLDSAPGSGRSYGALPSYIIPFRGDSTLMRDDVAQRVLRVLDGRGVVTRAIAVDMSASSVGSYGSAGASFADAHGRVVFTFPNRFSGTPVTIPASSLLRPDPPGRAQLLRGLPPALTVRIAVNDRPDSIPIERWNIGAQRVDTVGYVTQPIGWGSNGSKPVVVYDGKGTPAAVKAVINPLRIGDAWTVLSDGTIAIVRGHDYHVDWIHPDGSRSATSKLPFVWIPLSDDEKQRLLDSTRAVNDALDAWAVRRLNGTPAPGDSIAAYDTYYAAGGRGNCGPRSGAPNCPPNARRFPSEYVPVSEIPDYYPPITRSSAIADRDGNLWILPRSTTLSKQGELIYDVVNPKAGIVKRVRLPAGRSVAGFGRNGVVYLQVGDLRSGFVLEKTIVPK